MPLTITRTGTTGPIKLKLLNAPPGVKITPDEIGDKDNTILCKLEADAGTPIGVSSIQILAETSSGPVLVRTQPLIDKQLINVDLILHALREDQRRLPPSLSDRFALQIVPASPFTMELPESLVTLARYQRVEFPIVTTRVSGFDTPITFVAKGGQLADKSEGRTRVYAEFPDATPAKTSIRAGIQSKILTNLAKTRIEVTGTGIHQGRKIQLTRAFELNITTAFTLSSESPKVALLPGESTKAKLMLTRLPTFEGEVMLRLSPMQNVEFPETLLIPKGQSSVELPIVVSSTATPRNQRLTIHATGTVEGYEEELRVEPIEIEVKKVEPVKKK